jgi:hypothetical protein
MNEYTEFDDVREDPYSCPKGDSYEQELERADYLHDERKDREWEASVEAAQRRLKGYPKLRFRWHPKDGPVVIPDKLWGCIMHGRQEQVRKLRRARKPFQIIEHVPNGYRVEELKP